LCQFFLKNFLLSAAIFGSKISVSFGSALIPYISAACSEVRYERAVPYRIDMLQQFPADWVIVEIAERNLPVLIEQIALNP
jgi:hypothetical protein